MENFDTITKLFKDRCGVGAFAIFREREQIDIVVDSETFEQVVSTMVGAAVERPWNVGINSEYFHQLKMFQIDS